MQKKILIGFGIGIFLFLTTLVGCYFYAKSHVKDLVALGLAKAKEAGVELNFNQDPSTSGFYVQLNQFSAKGSNFAYQLNAQTVSLGPALNASWPPMTLILTLKHPVLELNADYVQINTPPAAKPESKLSPTIVSLGGFILGMSQFRLNIEAAEVKPFGIKGLSLSSTLKSLSLGEQGLKSALLEHDLLIPQIDLPSPLPIPGIRSKGTVFYQPPLFNVTKHTLSIGPLDVQANGRYNLDSQKWNADLYIPETQLKSTPDLLDTKLIPWLTSLSGQLYLKTSVQGMGPDLSSINAEGTVLAKGVQLGINHLNMKGNCLLNVDTAFTKGQTLALDSKIHLDLSQMEMGKEDLFKKGVTIPLVVDMEIIGQDRNFNLKQLEAKFSNLKATAKGDITTGPQTIANIQLAIAPTALDGWEKFFPRFSSIKTRGTLELAASYSGPVQDWKSSAMELNLKAKDIYLPILKNWIPNKNLVVEGVAHINSETRLSYLKGVLKNLATNTFIDLRENLISYGDFFHKKPGTAFTSDLAISSSATKAEIKRGDFVLGNIRGKLKGTIENFNAPTASLKFETGSIDTAEVLALSPASKQKNISQIRGNFSTRLTISGPLTNPKELPELKGDARLSKLGLDYELESSKKKIQIQNMSGVINFTNDSVTTKKFSVAFPHTDLTLDFQLNSFKEPQIVFTLLSPRFTQADFMDLTPKSGKGAQLVGAGMVPVPVSSRQPSSKEAQPDFRENSYLKTMRLKGDINIRNADLGTAKADSITAKIHYDKLFLQISPFTIKTFGGTIISNTNWDGRPKVPTTEQNLKIEGVDANQFLANCSEQAKDLLSGKLNADMKISLKGMDAEEMKKSARGEGNFALADGRLKTVRFTQKPMESLKKIPFLSKSITKTEWDEKLNEVTGRFTLADGKLVFSNMLVHSPYFDATASEATLDLDQNLSAKVVWVPKESLIAGSTLDALKDNSGHPNIPLVISGAVRSPSVNLDQGAIEGRVKAYAQRKIEEEGKRALSQAKDKVGNDLEKKLKEGLGGFFK